MVLSFEEHGLSSDLIIKKIHEMHHTNECSIPEMLRIGPFNYIDWGGPVESPIIHFAHGNGFPPGTYAPFLQKLAQDYRVISWECFGQEFPVSAEHLTDWEVLSHELLRFFALLGIQPQILVGHSFGAVISLLAHMHLRYPVKSLVLIDPVIFSKQFFFLLRLMKKLGKKHIPLAQMTLRKRDIWNSRKEVEQVYHSKKLFRRWQEDVFQCYIKSALRELETGEVQLRYPKNWEAAIFDSTVDRFWKETQEVTAENLILFRGGNSDTFSELACRQFRKGFPQTQCFHFATLSHCLIMEAPEALYRELIRILDIRN